MKKKLEINVDEILKKINQAAKRMQHANSINDKIGYDIALKEYETLYKNYSKLLYNNKEPSKVYHRRM